MLCAVDPEQLDELLLVLEWVWGVYMHCNKHTASNKGELLVITSQPAELECAC